VVGRDNHGTIHQAGDPRGRPVWVRVLTNPFSLGQPAAFAQLQKELRRLKHLVIASILQLIGDSTSGVVVAMVTEPIAGLTLTQWIARNGLPQPVVAAEVVINLAEALQFSARRRMPHGNLTPDNIVIDKSGKPRLTGFGLARLGCGPAASHAGDRAYAAPELLQSPDAQPTAQSDVYSLGIVFYQLLTGATPERDQGTGESRPPHEVNPRVPAGLDSICQRATAVDLKRRYATAAEFGGDLRKFLGIKQHGLLRRITDRSSKDRGGSATDPEHRGDFWK
jgi:serine/threonine-protein kinase